MLNYSLRISKTEDVLPFYVINVFRERNQVGLAAEGRCHTLEK
jgi:hypothetical protein